jgi:preprotein translocase subunit SecF
MIKITILEQISQMKTKIFFISTLFITLGYTSIGQEEKSNTIDEQFNDLIENSNSYQSFKVIEKKELSILQKNIHDSIAYLKTIIAGSETEISQQKSKIESFTHQIEDLKIDISQTQKKVDNIDFIGAPMQKKWYNSIVWSLIIALLFVSLILFFIYKKGRSKTKEARKKLVAIESELDSLRKRSLEREQKVRRELQDEINKNRLRNE